MIVEYAWLQAAKENESGLLREFSYDRLQQYLKKREKIDTEIKLIRSLTSMMSKFQYMDRGELEIDPVALGVVHQTIEQSVLEIWRELDDFLLVNNAKAALEEAKTTKTGTGII